MEYKRLTNKDTVNILKSTEFLLPSDKIYLRLAELEDMIESGQIRILPCKLGDHIYVITRIGNFIDLDEYIVDWFDTYNIDDKNIGFCFNGKDVEDYHLEFCCYDTDFGKTVFLTRKEAEAKLKELKDK